MPARRVGITRGGRRGRWRPAIRGGEVALLIDTDRDRQPVAIDAPDREARAIAGALDGSMFVRPARPSTGDDQAALVRVSYSPAGLQLCDSRGALARSWTRLDEGLEQLVSATERLVRSQVFLQLAGRSTVAEGNPYHLERRWAIDWGRVIDGRRQSFGDGAGATADARVEIRQGERIHVTLCNEGRTALYAAIYRVCATGSIRLLGTEHARRIAGGEAWVIGQYEHQDHGVEMTRPAGAPADERRLAGRLAIVLSDKRLDLRGLIQDEIQLENWRLSPTRHEDLCYRIEVLHYTLVLGSPGPRSSNDPG